jgi:hypothetical protein
MFAARKQKSTETIENYAADLKKLYEKAYARRDPRTREEDLLRKFLDGLQDTKAASHVEFVKDPKSIDAAMDEVINFHEVHRKLNKPVRGVNHDCLSSEEEHNYTVARTAGRPVNNPTHHGETAPKEDLEAKVAELTKQLEQLRNSKTSLGPNPVSNKTQHYGRSPQAQGFDRIRSRALEMRCFNCEQVGHMKRDCPHRYPGSFEDAGRQAMRAGSRNSSEN